MDALTSLLPIKARWMRWLISLVFLFWLGLICSVAGCQSMGPVHDYCQIAKPIYLQKGEAAKLSDATAREILTANETYSHVCGKP